MKWIKALKQLGIYLFGILLSVVIMIGIFMLAEGIQKLLFVSSDYLAFGMNSPGIYLIFFFEIESIILVYLLVLRKNKIIGLKTLFKRRVKVGLSSLIVLSILIFVLCINSITIVTRDEIIIRNGGFWTEKKYRFDQVTLVEDGYFSKGREKGSFYYNVTMKDGKKITLTNCTGSDSIYLDGKVIQEDEEEMNTYLWLDIVDRYIMQHAVIKKSDLASIKDAYSYDKIYLQLFQKIMKNGYVEDNQ